MIKAINNINTIMAGLISVKEIYPFINVKLKNNFSIKIYGDIKKADKIMISLHGVGGEKNSNYNINFCNSYIDEFYEDGCFITFDMPGVGDNIDSKYFWGASIDSIDVNLDEVISYIHHNNAKCKIFITAVSGSCYHLIAYFTDSENHIKNKFKDRINYTYLISPLVDFKESLDWAKENSPFISYISFYTTYSQTKFLIKNKNYKRLLNVKDSIFNIKNSNLLINDNGSYTFNFENKINNCDVILSKNDTITNYDITIKFLNKFDKFNIIHYNLGGHVGFFNFNLKKRKHEEYIINSIKQKC